MILAGGLVRVIILERPETCSFVQFSIKAFGLCPWTCHFSNPEILPVILRLGGSECCVRSGSPWKEHCLYQECFCGPSGGLWLRADGMSHCVTPLNLTGCLSLLNCWQGGPVGNASSWLAQWPTGGHGGVPGDPGNTQGQSQGSAAWPGCAYPDPDPATQEPRVWLWFGFHSHAAHSDRFCSSRDTWFGKSPCSPAHCGATEGAGFGVTLESGPNLTCLLGTVGADWFWHTMKEWAFDTSAWKGRKKEANSVL